MHTNDHEDLPSATAGMAAAIARVALIAADGRYRDELGRSLADEGYDVRPFGHGRAALDGLSAAGADLVLLDWNLPGTDAAALLLEARTRGIAAPVLCLAGGRGPSDEEAALAHGALDYVEKSRCLPILLKRMSLILDGTKSAMTDAAAPSPAETEAGVRTLGPLELRADRALALWRGAPVGLTATEFRIVEFMASRPDEDVSYREIYDLVRGRGFLAGHGADGYRNNVRAFIKRIRQKFRAVDPEFDRIGNYPGFGYRWLEAAADEA